MNVMDISELEHVAGGFAFAEGPRWHNGAIYVTNVHDEGIDRVAVDGLVTRAVDLPGSPISLGFLSDGTMLVSSLSAGKLWKVEDGVVSTLVDLSKYSEFDWGDIVVDDQDRIYIANQGMSWPDRVPEKWDSKIFLISDESAQLLGSDFVYANGLAITPDSKTLIVAESFSHRLLKLPIHDDGTLGERELIVQFDESHRPDGICCDAEGSVWSANATSRLVVRCTLAGEITHEISTGDDLAIGCILGGDDGCDLFITTAPASLRDEARRLRGGAVWRTRADVPAGGRP